MVKASSNFKDLGVRTARTQPTANSLTALPLFADATPAAVTSATTRSSVAKYSYLVTYNRRTQGNIFRLQIAPSKDLHQKGADLTVAIKQGGKNLMLRPHYLAPATLLTGDITQERDREHSRFMKIDPNNSFTLSHGDKKATVVVDSTNSGEIALKINSDFLINFSPKNEYLSKRDLSLQHTIHADPAAISDQSRAA